MGLVIDKQYTFLAGSPDGKVTNKNGNDTGLIEVKNLLQNKNITFMQATKKVKTFCLEENSGTLRLKPNHPYFYQCQGLMNITGLPWIDFVARTTNPYQLHIERIMRDANLWNNTMLPKLKAFYYMVLLPELAAPRNNKSPGIREPGVWFSIDTSSAKKKSKSTSRKRKQAPIPHESENETLDEVEDSPSSSKLVHNRSKLIAIEETNSTVSAQTEKRKPSRTRKQKFVGRRISHKWIIDEVQQKEVWYDGTVLSLLSGNDGDNCAEYDIYYDGDNSSYSVNHLVEDYKDSSVKFLDL